MADDDPTYLSNIARVAAAQGYLLLPASSADPISPGTPFNTKLATQPDIDPFITDRTPFDIESLGASMFIYRSNDNCRGTYVSAVTSSSRSSTDHLSLALGVSVGNKYVGAGVTGSYDKAVLKDKSMSKVSRKVTFQSGDIQFEKPPSLSNEARQLLLAKDGGGYEAFVKQYGDYYVSGIAIGGDASLLVSQDIDKSLSVEALQVKLRVQFLCFSHEETIYDQPTKEAMSNAKLNVMAFDSLERSFVSFSGEDDTSLAFADARRLATEYAGRVENLADRVQKEIKRLGGAITDGASMNWAHTHGISQTNVVSRLVLVPYATHREIAQYMPA